MNRDAVIDVLRRSRQELVGWGVESLAVVGSVARGEETAKSDVDLLVRLADTERGFAHLRLLEVLEVRLSEILNCRVDLIEDTAAPPSVRREIEKDRVVAF